VNSLNPESEDDRTPEKLIDGENDEIDGSHCWIAPILPNIVRRLKQKQKRIRTCKNKLFIF